MPRNRSNSRFAEPALQRTQKGNQLVLLRWCQTVEIAGQPSSCSSTVEHEALKNVQRRWRVIVPGNLDMLNHFCNEYGFSHEGNGLFQDEQKWREFVAKKNMDWAQYWDRDGQMRKRMNVHAFPTYMVNDPEGIIRERIVGMNPQESIVHRLKEKLQTMLPQG